MSASADISNHFNQRLILVTGPARSGKSAWAEALAMDSGKLVIYVATAQVDPTDREWQARIDLHRQRRPQHWTTLDVPLDLVGTIEQSGSDTCLLVDSLGTWLANQLDVEEKAWQQICQQFLECLGGCSCQVILVAEETGWGIVPAYPLGRTFRDRLGDLVRRIGAIADATYLVTGGYALNLAQLGIPLPAAGSLNQCQQNEPL